MQAPSDTAARRELLALVHRRRLLPNLEISGDLDELSPLYGIDRDRAVNELFDAVRLVESIEAGVTHWSEVVPDAVGLDRDGQALSAARTRVELALDALLGGAR
ncbi:hypothetical protein EBO15_01335 [Actinomadura harenae]|uniref:Uncharacterized protein n=2 Tax=Actinomadura harenae TaxID=2483351 RepID=A0A3M2MFC4_9ACTN|nr:hypothetical protein EBO15_01335 [Actinomadura harenae]